MTVVTNAVLVGSYAATAQDVQGRMGAGESSSRADFLSLDAVQIEAETHATS